MTIPAEADIAALIIADIDAIPLNLSEAEAKRQTWTAVAKRIRDAVLQATLTVPGAGLSVAAAPGPVAGTSITGTLS